MFNNSHKNVVELAILYIKTYGTPPQKEALNYLLGFFKPQSETELINSLVNEAVEIDYYRDLYIGSNLGIVSVADYLGIADNPLTSATGKQFTSLSHFVNAWPKFKAGDSWFSQYPTYNKDLWTPASGYHYFWSSRDGDDEKAFVSSKVPVLGIPISNAEIEVFNKYQFQYLDTSHRFA